MKRGMHVCSMVAEGGKNLSAHFKVREFSCNDGSDAIFVAEELVSMLEKIRVHFNKPVVITSGYRTPSHNKAIGGAARSQHIYGTAADIVVQGVNASEVADYVETLMKNKGGIGRYNHYTHIDVRNTKSRWKG